MLWLVVLIGCCWLLSVLVVCLMVVVVFVVWAVMVDALVVLAVVVVGVGWMCWLFVRLFYVFGRFGFLMF